MRNLMFAALAASALVPVAAGAQSLKEAQESSAEVRKDMAEVREDIAKGDMEEAREDLQEAREDAEEAREDWMDYRKAHPEAFKIGAYVGPDGYVYEPRAVGYVFAPDYLTEKYWLNDYATYHLGAPPAGQRYIRYGNDVALIDIATGKVISVYSPFFY